MIETELKQKQILTVDTPMYFGAEGDEPQPTFLSDEPIIISDAEREQLIDVTTETANFIRNTPMDQSLAENIGISPRYFNDVVELDSCGNSELVYGGLDISRSSSNGQFKVIEINPRVQAMGLQDFRQEVLGVDNPSLLDGFTNWLCENGYENITLLGSTKNAFFRGYDRVTSFLNDKGINTIFTDIQGFMKMCSMGYNPQLIFRNCANDVLLNNPEFKNIVKDKKIKIVNPLHASFYGYRGFLRNLQKNLPDVLPGQITLNKDTTEADLRKHPWLKLEAKGEEYVVNFNELRKWGKTAVLNILHHDFDTLSNTLSDKNGGDANKLRDVGALVQGSDGSEVVWIAQEDIEPKVENISLDGKKHDVRLLYRTYFLYNKNKTIHVSAECFGCTNDQFNRSKGKINAGTGFSVPIKNFK